MNVREALRAIREQGRYVLVVGLGISGVETIKFLQRCGVMVRAVEREERESYLSKSKFSGDVTALLSQGVEILFGIDGEMVTRHLKDVSLCVVSPGVSLESAIVGSLRLSAVAVISELEFGIELLGTPCIVVTGSNGKSTTVTLIHEMLSRSGFNSTLCGNVGVPAVASVPGAILDKPFSTEKSVLVVEASSYQLESCSVLSPKVAVLLNISENHLERHGTMERYLGVKARVFQAQDKSDFAVLGSDDQRLRALVPKISARCCGFGVEGDRGRNLGSFSEVVFEPQSGRDSITIALPDGKSEIYEVSGTKLRGIHNRLNIAAAALAARLFGATPEGIKETIEKFTSLEHRLETCGTIRGVTFINDSKSTTVAATVAALKAVLLDSKSGKVTLMIGGLSKAGSWDPVVQLLDKARDNLHPVICFGKDGRLLGSNCAQLKLPYRVATTLQEGVGQAFEQSGEGDLVLLSPGCASFDQFTDFENRGSVFKSIVAALTENKAA